MFIPVILGTARAGRRSENLAKIKVEHLEKHAAQYGVQTELIDVRDFRHPATDNDKESDVVKKFSEKISPACGLIIVSPEYNHSFPGELKMMIDMLYDEYAKKPVGFCGVSSGPWGGNRVVEQLRTVAIELHMVPIREALYFPLVQSLFDEKGKMKDPASYEPRIKTFMDELMWYAKPLKTARG